MTERDAKTVCRIAKQLIPGIKVTMEESKAGNWDIDVRWPDDKGWSSRDFNTGVMLTAYSAEEARHVHEGSGIDNGEVGEAGVQDA